MKTLYVGSSSACFELDRETAYFAPCSYHIVLNGQNYGKKKENIFSFFELEPDTKYALRLIFEDGTEEKADFETASETCCASVMDFGAKGDGQHEDTAAIQTAINTLPKGSRLIFPAGTYLTLPLSLRSDITLEIKKDAVLLGSVERERYPVIPGAVDDNAGNHIQMCGFEGEEKPCYQSLIHASYAENIKIIGEGRIDGNGQNGDWWVNFQNFEAARPRVLFINRCSNVILHGVTFSNSPSWHIHPFFSENISCYHIAVEAPKDSPNTDALNPESCRDVVIAGCHFSVGDDCIALKSGKIDLARQYRKPLTHCTIRNCWMENGHGAVALGSEIGAGIYDLKVINCLFTNTDRGLRIKSRRGRGKDTDIDRVVFDHILMKDVLTPIVINMWYNCCDPDRFSEYVWSREKLPVDDRTPHFEYFLFRNIECQNVSVAGCYIDGLPESPIDEVHFENIRMIYAPDAKPGIPAMQNFAKPRCRLGLYFNNVREIILKNVSLSGQDGMPVIAENYEKLDAGGMI